MTEARAEEKPQEGFRSLGLLTLFVLAAFGSSEPLLQSLFLAAFALALGFPRVARMPVFWLGVAAIHAPLFVYGWEFIGNQKYVQLYWVLGLAIASHAQSFERSLLAKMACYLVVLIFAGATLWKWTSADYVSGTFMHLLLLTNGALQYLAAFALEPTVNVDLYAQHLDFVQANPQHLEVLLSGVSGLDSVPLNTGEGIKHLALLLTALSLITQTGIALCFAVDAFRPHARLRAVGHLLLLEFLLTAYLPTQVIGFGALLAVMGLALCRPEETRMRTAYRIVLVVMVLYGLPLSQLSAPGHLFAHY